MSKAERVTLNDERASSDFAHKRHVQFMRIPGFCLVGGQVIGCIEGV